MSALTGFQLINNIKTMSSLLGKIIADFDTSISAKISIGGTTATLLSILDDDGATIANGRYFITIDGDNSSKEHFSCTLTGTALTALKSISRKGVESSGAVREHRVGATVTMTNFAHIKFLNDLLDGTTDLDGSTPLKYDANPTLTDDKHIATKKYIDDIAIAGCSKATDSAYGISKLSVAAASPTVPIAVGDNDPRIPTQDENNALAGTPRTPSSAIKYLNHKVVVSHTANTAGYLTGGSSAQSAFASWAAVTDGSFGITVDGTAYNVDAVDFTGDGDMDAVAATLQAALRTATSGNETVVWSTDHFVITSIQEDEDSEISVTTTSTGTVGTDISGLGANDWMDCDSGNGVATQGTSDHDSLVKLDTVGKIESELIEKDTDGALAANSDDRIASQKAVKTYADTKISEFSRGVNTRLFQTATGTQVIAHGLSKAPKRVRISARFAPSSGPRKAISDGVFTGGGQNSCVYIEHDLNGDVSVSGTIAYTVYIMYGTNNADYQLATISVDATNITISWTKVGSTITGSIHFLWEAEA